MATATRTSTKARKEYLNTTQGYLGAVQINRKGDEAAVPVEPGGRVFLTDEEKELTARSHRSASDSPFVPKQVVHRDPLTGEVLFEGELCPLEDATAFARSGGKVPESASLTP